MAAGDDDLLIGIQGMNSTLGTVSDSQLIQRQNNRRSMNASAEVQALENMHRAVNAEKKNRQLTEENERLKAEQSVVKDAVYELIRERKELYNMFSHLAQRWGQTAPSAEAMEEKARTQAENPDLGAELISKLEGDVRIEQVRARRKKR